MNTFKKLPNGDWGVLVFPRDANPGDVVEVQTRAGAIKQVTLGAVVSSDQYGRVHATVRAAAAPRATEVVGDLSGIVAMLTRAASRLRFPAIVLDGFRVSIAGARAAQPGSLTVTGVDRVFNSYRGREERPWFGRVSTAGEFQPGRGAPADLGDKLRRFAADPAGEAAAYGRLHGRCCFCNHPLRDERSTAVGYGPDCADNFGLAWGARAAAAAQAAPPRRTGAETAAAAQAAAPAPAAPDADADFIRSIAG